MGEHGMWWKNAMYEQISRRAPGDLLAGPLDAWPTTAPATSSHVDLVQTLADIANGHTPEDWNGSSLTPWLDNSSHAWKDFAASEYYAHFIASGYVMARSGRWKYTYHTPADKNHPAVRELYNLSTDPREFDNLAAKPEARHPDRRSPQENDQRTWRRPRRNRVPHRHQLSAGYTRTDSPAGHRLPVE